MNVSLDTNVIIHLYRAGQKRILFNEFRDHMYMYEQIRKIELENHGEDILQEVDEDIQACRLEMITDEK